MVRELWAINRQDRPAPRFRKRNLFRKNRGCRTKEKTEVHQNECETTKKSTPYTVPSDHYPGLKEPVMFTFQMEGEIVKSVDFLPAIPTGH